MPRQQLPDDSSNPVARERPSHPRARFRLAPLALALAGTLVVAACTTGGSGEPGGGSSGGGGGGGTSGASGGGGGGGTFAIGIGVDLDTVDPAQQTTTTVQNVIDYGLETLTELTKDGKTTPGLATSWKVSADGKTMTLKLRKGVKFQDGTDFDAKAVKFNLDRIRDPKVKVPIGGAFQVIKNVKVVDPHTVQLDLKYPDPTLISNLGITTSAIISPASATKDGNSYTNIVKPVGTGPYTFQSFSKGDKAVYQRFDGYWGKKPYYSQVVFQIIPEGNSREAALRSGEVQMIMNPPVTDLAALDKDPSINVLKAPSDRSIFIAFNNSKPPFDNAEVRRALNYAVDKKSIIKNVLFDTVDLMDSPLASSLSGYCKVGAYAYDPAKAKQMLADAGATKLSVTLGTPTGRYLQDKQASQAIAANLRDVGVDVKVSTTDWPSYIAGFTKKDGPYDFHLLGWAPGALDAATQFQMFEKAQWPPTGLATAFYTDPKVESLIAKGNQELDDQKRNDLYCQAQKQIWHDAPWLFLWSQTLDLAYSSDVAGISYVPNEKFDTIYAHPAG
ncbi:ABC transporter substrate-binding protein [Segeticoccus rhizosphaerae]|jgi:peptide/nickel transport system substrate-binding protein|uniref:ABC transporter substrate-binding protein n=2 Tax=Segeticoccus rhizosphaerae TaxID=1104777 RepID=UPI0010BF855A|nr:ABC transporter substrate-binding protein [Ornithinicoccus soli]